jgi:hypothetical protein
MTFYRPAFAPKYLASRRDSPLTEVAKVIVTYRVDICQERIGKSFDSNGS